MNSGELGIREPPSRLGLGLNHTWGLWGPGYARDPICPSFRYTERQLCSLLCPPPLWLCSASLVRSPERRDGHPPDLSLAQEEEAPPPTSDRGQCPSSKLAGASPLVRDVPESVRGLGAQGGQLARRNSVAVGSHDAFLDARTAWQPASSEGFCSGEWAADSGGQSVHRLWGEILE